MPLVREITAVLRTELKCHTAWPPIATKVALGDFGVLDRDNIFNKLGSLQELKIPFAAEEGTPARIDFTSADTTITRVTASGEVNVFPQAGIDASMRIRFESADALMLKAASITVRSMANVGVVAARLKSIHAPGWKSSNLVVGAVFNAEKPLLLGTREAGTEVSFDGKTDALKALEVGRVEAGVGFSSNKELGLKVLGESGVLGVRLFRLRFGNPEFLRPGDPPAGAPNEPDHEWLL